MFTGIHHIGYHVSDIEAAVKAYVEMYGGEVEVQFYNAGAKSKVAFVKTGDTRVELMEPDDKSVLGGAQGQILHHVGYLVPDLHAAAEQLRSRGARFLTEEPVKNPYTGWQVWYFDGGPVLGVKQHISVY